MKFKADIIFMGGGVLSQHNTERRQGTKQLVSYDLRERRSEA